jgi:hypothetical protein
MEISVLLAAVLFVLLEFAIVKDLASAQTIACGVANQGIGLIVGGKTAKKGDFPW